MSAEPNPSRRRRKDPDLTPRKGFSPIPRMPGERDPALVLRNVRGETGILFWHLLGDVDLWSRAPGERLFWPREDAALLVELCPEPIRPAVRVIARIWWTP